MLPIVFAKIQTPVIGVYAIEIGIAISISPAVSGAYTPAPHYSSMLPLDRLVLRCSTGSWADDVRLLVASFP